jgi:hypothetical protein
LKQVYELETAVIECIQNSLSNEIVQNIIQPFIQDVFEFNVVSNHCASVEFITDDALRQCLLTSETIKQRFGVNIKYDIKYVETDERVGANLNASCASSNIKSTKVKAESIPSQTRITIPRGSAMVAAHPTFSIEYKHYIRK